MSTSQIEVEQGAVDGPHGSIPVRIYRPASEAGLGLVWVHGGGFIAGDLDMIESDWVARCFAESGVMVVTVDYQLSAVPERFRAHVDTVREGVRFPVASEEVAAVHAWATGPDGPAVSGGWAVGGASAGGNLTASLALRLRDEGASAVAVLLAYPVLHYALPPFHRELQEKYDTMPRELQFGDDDAEILSLNYVGDRAALENPYAFPGGHDVTGFPPTFILNSEFDALRSSGQAFGAELAVAGVDVAVAYEPGAFHGHLNEPTSPEARRSVDRMSAWLQRFNAAAD